MQYADELTPLADRHPTPQLAGTFPNVGQTKYARIVLGACSGCIALLSVWTIPTIAAGTVTCAQVVELGRAWEKGDREVVAASKGDFLGKPLLQYSDADLQTMEHLAEGCVRPYWNSPDIGFVLAGERAIQGLRHALREEQQALKDSARKRELKSGKAKIETIRDASLFYDADPFASIMNSPLIRPNNLMYSGSVILEQEDGSGLLRVRRDLVDFYYGYIRISERTKILKPELMRTNAYIGVVGRYTENVKYQTIAGVVKVGPLLEVIYVGEPPKNDE